LSNGIVAGRVLSIGNRCYSVAAKRRIKKTTIR